MEEKETIEQKIKKLEKSIKKIKRMIVIIGVPIVLSTLIGTNIISSQIVNQGDWLTYFGFMIPAAVLSVEAGIGVYIEYKLTDKKYKLIDNLKLKAQMDNLNKEQKQIVKEAKKNADIVQSIQKISNLNLNEDNLNTIKVAVLDKNISKTICFTDFKTLQNYDFDNEEKYDKEYEEIMTKRPKQKIKSKFKRDNRE